MATTEQAPSTTTPALRLASQRPIDHRWDRSRGIVFTSAPLPHHHRRGDLTWHAHNGIIFSSPPPPVQRRAYATRPGSLIGDETAPPSRARVRASAPPSRLGTAPPLDPSNTIATPRSVADQDAMVQFRSRMRALEQEGQRAEAAKKAAVREKEAVAMEAAAAQEALRKEVERGKGARGEIDALTQRLADAASSVALLNEKVAGLERELSARVEAMSTLEQQAERAETEQERMRLEHQTRVDELTKKAAEELTLQTSEWREQEAELRTPYKMLVKRAKGAAEKLLDERKTTALRVEQSLGHRLHRQTAGVEASFAKVYMDTSRALKEQYDGTLNRTSVAHSNYLTYRKAWDVILATNTVFDSIWDTVRVLRTNAEEWAQRLESYQGAEIDPSFPTRYAGIDNKIRQFLGGKHRRARQAARSLASTQDKLEDAFADLQETGHNSRQLTKALRLDTFYPHAKLTDTVYRSVMDMPWADMRRQVDRDLASVTDRVAHRQFGVLHNMGDSLANRQQFERLTVLLNAFREFEAAKARRTAPAVEKEAFAATYELMLSHLEMRRVYRRYGVSRPVNVEGSNVLDREEKRSRNAVREELQGIQEAEDEFIDHVRRRRYLQIFLGDGAYDDKGADAAVEAEITRCWNAFVAQITSFTGSSFLKPVTSRSITLPQRQPFRTLKSQTQIPGYAGTHARISAASTPAAEPTYRNAANRGSEPRKVRSTWRPNRPMRATGKDRIVVDSAPRHIKSIRPISLYRRQQSGRLFRTSPSRMYSTMVESSTDQSSQSSLDSGSVLLSTEDASAQVSALSSQDSQVGSDSRAQDTPEDDLGSKDVPSQLSYRISPEDYREAAMASPNTNAAFWSYRLYKNDEGKSPVIYYCTNLEQAETRTRELLDEPVVGFDIEWEIGTQPEQSSIQHSVSLIQLASESKIVLIHIAVFKGDTPEELLPPSLRAMIESNRIAKVGVNIRGDATRIETCFNVEMKGLFELSHLYRVVTFGHSAPAQVNWRLVRLADQVQNILLLPLKKDEVRTSRWSRKLDMQQSEYAASDAYAGFQLYHALEAKRKLMQPPPPRPAFHEERKPLALVDGSEIGVAPAAIKRRRVPRRAEVAATEEETDEFFDAQEEQQSTELDPLEEPTTSIDDALAGLSIASPEPSKPNPRSPPPSSAEVAQADKWIHEFRSSLPEEYNLRVRDASLRAYHLWHAQRLDCPGVAAVLRDPPLASTTVATYILEALRHENLPFSSQRLRDSEGPLAFVPGHVHRRYAKVLGRTG